MSRGRSHSGLRYPITYQCRRCPATIPGLLRAKCHVYLEHGIAWKRTRSCLRVVGIHEQLPDIELLGSEKRKGERVRGKRQEIEKKGVGVYA